MCIRVYLSSALPGSPHLSSISSLSPSLVYVVPAIYDLVVYPLWLVLDWILPVLFFHFSDCRLFICFLFCLSLTHLLGKTPYFSLSSVWLLCLSFTPFTNRLALFWTLMPTMSSISAFYTSRAESGFPCKYVSASIWTHIHTRARALSQVELID